MTKALDPEGARASLAMLDAIDATWVLPGHGDPWNAGLAGAPRLIRAKPVAAARS